MEVLRRDERLAPFIMDGNLTGRHLGSGLYGSAEEVSSYAYNIKKIAIATAGRQADSDPHDSYSIR